MPMPTLDASAIADLTDLADDITINAFDQFRGATIRAGLPLPVVNAFAFYRSAVDFAYLAAKAQAAGDADEAVKLVGWARGMLQTMGSELASLADAAPPTRHFPVD